MVSGEKKLKPNFPDHFWCFPDQSENNSKIVTYREAPGKLCTLRWRCAESGAATHVGEATHTAAGEEAASTRAAAPEYPSGRKHT